MVGVTRCRSLNLPYNICMSFQSTLRGERFVFADLRELLAKANEEKSGDGLAGIAARSERERVAAKFALAGVCLSEIVATPLVDDEVTRRQIESHDTTVFAEIRSMSVGELRQFLVGDATDESTLQRLEGAIKPEN